MPRHLINDAHEWKNEILTVPTYNLVKQQRSERALKKKAGKEDPVELDYISYLIDFIRIAE